MRVYSTPESVLRNEISILAIIETVIVLFVSIFIAIYYDYYWHIAIGASLGFFLLLRTDASVSRGFTWYANFTKYRKKIEVGFEHRIKRTWAGPTYIALIVIPLIGCAAFFIKIFATVSTVLQRPIYSIKEIPLNWFKIAFTIDLTHPPEILPGIETHRQGELKRPATPTWERFIDFYHKLLMISKPISIGSIYGMFLTIIPYILYISAFTCFFLPAYLYRFSLKSTTLIYFPLIWLIGGKTQNQKNIKLIVDDLLESKYERLKYYFSWFAIFVLTIFPLCLSFYWQNLINILSGKEVLIYFFPLEQIGSWHITRVAGALITIILIIFADKLRIRLNHPDYSLGQVKTFFIILGIRLRVILGIWTLGCGFSIIMSIVDWSTFPIIKWLPF